MPAPLVSVTQSAIHKAVIPAAGLGTRLRPLTHAYPKELLPVGRLPVLAHIAGELRGAGITDALFIVSERKPQIRAFFGDVYSGDTQEHNAGSQDLPPLHCHYVTQREQRGLGDALLYAEEWVGNDPFAVAFGDCLIEAPDPAAPLAKLLSVHQQKGSAATVLAETVEREKVSRYGVLAPAQEQTVFDAPLLLCDIIEKPTPENAPSNLVVAARWVLDAAIFPYLRQIEPDARGELNLPDAVRLLLRDNSEFWAVPLQSGEFRRDIGNFETFFAAFVRAALRDTEFGETARRAARELLTEL